VRKWLGHDNMLVLITQYLTYRLHTCPFLRAILIFCFSHHLSFKLNSPYFCTGDFCSSISLALPPSWNPHPLPPPFCSHILSLPSGQSRPLHLVHAPQDEIEALHCQHIARLLLNKPPSSLAEPREFKVHQESPDGPYFFFNRPPSGATTIPVTLLHPIFGEFIDDCETHLPTRQDNSFALKLSTTMSSIYENEETWVEDFCGVLKDFGIVMVPTQVNRKFYTDGDIQYNSHHYRILKGKMEIGSKGAKPLFQAGWYYQYSAKEASVESEGSCHPCLLVYLFGLSITLPSIECC
jgi:hypothetical protein